MVVDLRRLRKDYEESQPLNTLVNVFGTVDPKTFIFKTGELSQNLSYRGRDAGCRGQELIDDGTAKISSAMRVFDPRFRLTSEFIKRSHPLLQRGRFSSPVVNEAVAGRHAFLEKKGSSLYTFDSFLSVTFRPNWASPKLADRLKHLALHPADALRKVFSAERRALMLDEELASGLRTLHYAVQSFIEQTSDHLDVRVLSAEEGWTRLYRPLLNPDPAKAAAVPLGEGKHLDFLLVDSVLEAFRDHLRLGNHYVKPLTLKKLPGHTYANMFAALSRVNADLIVVTDWNVLDSAEAAAMLRSKRRHWHNTKTSLFSQVWSDNNSDRQTLFDESNEALIRDAGACLEVMEIHGDEVGRYGQTVLVLGTSLEEVERSAAEVMKVFGMHDAALNAESYNGINAYLGATPGGSAYNLRNSLVTNGNHADMLLLFHPAEGERINAFLGKEYLAELETEERSLYYFNRHKEDVGHTLIIGPTGSGKSFLLNFLITHAQKYDPYTIIFTVGPDFRWLAEACGGSYVSFLPDERSFFLNPYSLEPTAENLEFLTSWTRLIAEQDAPPLCENDIRETFEAIRSLYVLDPSQRRLLTLSTTVSRSIGKRLKRWTEGEQYGGFFDNPDALDNVSYSRFQCVNFEGVKGNKAVLEAASFYMIHRVNDVVYDPALLTTYKDIVLDETWFFNHPSARDYIATAARTWRKRNASITLSTQSVRDFADVERFGPIFESCPTKLLLANPSLDAQLYGDLLRLTPTEQEKVRELIPKRQFLLKREGFAKVLNLNVDPRSYWLFTTNPFEAKRREEEMKRSGSLAGALDALTGGSQ